MILSRLRYLPVFSKLRCHMSFETSLPTSEGYSMSTVSGLITSGNFRPTNQSSATSLSDAAD